MTNNEVADLLDKIAVVYILLEENRFKIIAYEKAADNIRQLPQDIQDIWKKGELSQVSGVGNTIGGHLDELFRTGAVRHFNTVLCKIPSPVFTLLSIPGLGPKKAYKIVTELKLTNPKTVVEDVKKAAISHKIAALQGFGDKSEQDLLRSIEEFVKGQAETKRILLYEADILVFQIIQYLKKNSNSKGVDILGSFRRRKETVGDIDIAVSTNKPDDVVKYFTKYPNKKVVEQGAEGATIRLKDGTQIDLRVSKPGSYGSMLQYFTGSNQHNIKLREHALSMGKSLSEYGIKSVRTKKLTRYPKEDAFYKALGLTFIPPEIREDTGEIELAKAHKLPDLVGYKDIKGDMHIHTNYNIEPSHDLGSSSLHEYLDKALSMGLSYIAINDHNTSIGNHSEKDIVRIMKKRKLYYEQQYYSWIKSVQKENKGAKNQVKIFIMCEVDIRPDGELALPASALDYVDGIIVSIHSVFNQEKDQVTKRIITALNYYPKVRILGHPAGRLIGKRNGMLADWERIFSICRQRDIALEINAHPIRLDLPDILVKEAKQKGVRMSIGTDSHSAKEMDFLRYGVDVARRGWCEKHDIINSLVYDEVKKWLIR